MDFKNRMGISLSDFGRGLYTFGIKMSPQDKRAVFAYLCGHDYDTLSNNTLMTFDQFIKIRDEQAQRNIDPFELQVFQENLSANMKEYGHEYEEQEKLLEITKELT